MIDDTEFVDEGTPEATDNGVRPEDGVQDVSQDPTVEGGGEDA